LRLPISHLHCLTKNNLTFRRDFFSTLSFVNIERAIMEENMGLFASNAIEHLPAGGDKVSMGRWHSFPLRFAPGRKARYRPY
jgi:hypothetical protein